MGLRELVAQILREMASASPERWQQLRRQLRAALEEL